MRRILYWLLRLLFRFRAYNTEVLKTPGPVLLVPNHVAWIDWLFIYVLLDLDWKCVVSRVAAEYSWLHRKIMLNHRSLPIDNTSPYAVKHMAEFLDRGGRLVLFAEGQITRTGSLMKIYEGTGFLLHKTGARVITCYVRGANRSRWSRQPGWRRWWPQVSVHFSQAVTPPELPGVPTSTARERLTVWLQRRMVEQQFQTEMRLGPANVLDAVVEAAARQPRKVILQDSTMRELPYRRLTVGADLLARRLRTRLASDGLRVGVLLPNANVTPVLLLALWTLGRTPAILNFSTGPQIMARCCQVADLKQVITSRAFIEKGGLDLTALRQAGLEFVYVEDLRDEIAGWERVVTLARHFFNPRALKRQRVARSSALEDAGQTAVVLFTSGSEGLPKGVELTHGNLLANVRQMEAVIAIEDSDRIFNALPLFHSFGLTVGTLLGLIRGIYIFLYPSPLHFRVIPSVVYDRHCTLMLSTNTFLQGYARKAHPYDFRAVRWIFSGAEKLQPDTSRLWADRFGIRVFEGYGVTECSPVISVNTPMAPLVGSAGRFVPGMEWKLEPVDGVSEGGRLLVRGPNVMRGYLNAEANAKFRALEGWYDTGDIASVDEDGFLFIRGRLKRFAKISGEMISLTSVEEALSGGFPQLGQKFELAVVSRPDSDKGECIIAVTNDARLTVNDLRQVLRAGGWSNLCVPREVVVVREIPKLGTGKVNHRLLAELVQECTVDAPSA
ncbi:MAG: AMP-binding protein [Verrucomicrobiales bacterium]|nr:AMP-binding protein [Verrucomicrobiales bacterium]MCP5526258.1 AMP-binding protein [Verrucomicrobiales bacterium]